MLQRTLLSGEYAFDALREIRTDSEVMEVWGARDALVLKALACVLGDLLDPVISEFCHHIKGRGGAKEAIRNTIDALSPGQLGVKSTLDPCSE